MKRPIDNNLLGNLCIISLSLYPSLKSEADEVIGTYQFHQIELQGKHYNSYIPALLEDFKRWRLEFVCTRMFSDETLQSIRRWKNYSPIYIQYIHFRFQKRSFYFPGQISDIVGRPKDPFMDTQKVSKVMIVEIYTDHKKGG